MKMVSKLKRTPAQLMRTIPSATKKEWAEVYETTFSVRFQATANVNPEATVDQANVVRPFVLKEIEENFDLAAKKIQGILTKEFKSNEEENAR